MQSWGESSKFNVRGTLPFPTYSGLLGLFSAALGYGRDDAAGREWLRLLDVKVRVDQHGQTLRDYHTIGSSPTREFVTPTGGGKPWKLAGAGYPTNLTERYYLTNAIFTVFITGSSEHVTKLRSALQAPVWQLSLGRKACIPDYPLVLGTSTEPAVELVETVPVFSVGEKNVKTVRLDVHYLTSKPDKNLRFVLHGDNPLGAHPQDGYGQRARWVDKVGVNAPIVTSHEVFLTWVTNYFETEAKK
jgi:CRISPR system Cascade subunit CasD